MTWFLRNTKSLGLFESRGSVPYIPENKKQRFIPHPTTKLDRVSTRNLIKSAAIKGSLAIRLGHPVGMGAHSICPSLAKSFVLSAAHRMASFRFEESSTFQFANAWPWHSEHIFSVFGVILGMKIPASRLQWAIVGPRKKAFVSWLPSWLL